MSRDQLNACFVITQVINMAATRQGSSQHLLSDVRDYFDKVEGKSVTCKVCKLKFAYHGGTTHLRNHLQRTHGAMYVPEGQKKIKSDQLEYMALMIFQLRGVR